MLVVHREMPRCGDRASLVALGAAVDGQRLSNRAVSNGAVSNRAADVVRCDSVRLAIARLLDGKRATTHWRFADRLQAHYPTVRVALSGSTPPGPPPPDGDTFTLRPKGWGRYIDVVFLAAWLAGWAVGELVGLALLGMLLLGAIGAAFGVSLPYVSRVSSAAAASLFGLFMIAWITLWTVVGIAALTHFLRSLAGEDRLSVLPDGLHIEWRAGPFRRRRLVPHAAIRRIRLRMSQSTPAIDTSTGTIDLTTFGTRDDRASLQAWLRQRLVLPDEAQARQAERETTPVGWEVEVEGMETRLARPPRRTRAIQAAILWGLVALVSLGAIAQLRTGSHPAERLVSPAIGLPLALWAIWITWGRTEWIVSRGRLVRRRRFGAWRRELAFEEATLEIAHSVDSDGDARFTLSVRAGSSRGTIATALHDAAELASLAEWLAARTTFRIERPSIHF